METNDGRCLRSEVGWMRTEGIQGNGRDTMVCGDPKTWFLMRRVSSGKKGREWWWR